MIDEDMAGELTDEELQQHMLNFVEELNALCNEYGLGLGVCDECLEIELYFLSSLFNKFTLDGTHVVPSFIDLVKAA